MIKTCLSILLLTIGSGCAVDMEGSYARMAFAEKPPMTRDGKPAEVNRQSWTELWGPPRLIIPLPDRDLCVWTGAPFFHGKESRWDSVMSFDHDGDFVPTDLASLKPYCIVCWLRLTETKDGCCPRCGHLVSKDLRNDTCDAASPECRRSQPST